VSTLFAVQVARTLWLQTNVRVSAWILVWGSGSGCARNSTEEIGCSMQ